MKNKLVYLTVLGIVLFNTMIAFADTIPGDDGDGGLENGDPGPAPINGQIYILALLIITFMFFFLKRNLKKINK
ncbi:hypothetical protein [Flavobacterium sp.]|uniref:hypothetical protein n=1 Tax=Flavobacterium sp. TaxID=239 RepID=UPI00333FC28B